MAYVSNHWIKILYSLIFFLDQARLHVSKQAIITPVSQVLFTCGFLLLLIYHVYHEYKLKNTIYQKIIRILGALIFCHLRIWTLSEKVKKIRRYLKKSHALSSARLHGLTSHVGQ